MDTGDEVEAQVEAFAPTAVTLAEDAKDFESTDDLLDAKAEAGERAVGLFRLVGKRVLLAGFSWQTGVRVQLVESQIAEVGEHDGVGVKVASTILEQPEVVAAALTEGGSDDFAGFPVEQKLGLQRMAFFLPAIATPLFFWAALWASQSHQPPQTTARHPQSSGRHVCRAA